MSKVEGGKMEPRTPTARMPQRFQAARRTAVAQSSLKHGADGAPERQVA
ncbi:MAG: hypothetical protein ACE15C_03880 [Phycisphaerae bacterium]